MSDEEKRTYPSATPSTLRHSLRSQGNAPLTVRAPSSGGGTVAPRDGRASLGVPPLKMVLVHVHDGHAPEAVKAVPAVIRPEEQIAEDEVAVRVIVRLIEHLKKE